MVASGREDHEGKVGIGINAVEDSDVLDAHDSQLPAVST